ncbi:hypothetical protein [Halomontanus rarus]|uniref:hypothetical protein n=1 Tax=Halomontanus rarus TaxID=3034020 RepID=UPI001A990B5A
MSRASAKDLVTFMEDEASEYLRSVAHFDGKDRKVLYLEDDIEDQYSEDELEEVFDSLFFESFDRSHQEHMYPHGQLNCIVRCFDEALELHFPHSDTAGTAVALEPEATSDLEGLVDDCLNELYGEYPPTE